MTYLPLSLFISWLIVFFIATKYKFSSEFTRTTLFGYTLSSLLSFFLYSYWMTNFVHGFKYVILSMVCYIFLVWFVFHDPLMPVFFRKIVILISDFFGFFLSHRLTSPPIISHTELTLGFLLGAFCLWIAIVIVFYGYDVKILREIITGKTPKLVFD